VHPLTTPLARVQEFDHLRIGAVFFAFLRAVAYGGIVCAVLAIVKVLTIVNGLACAGPITPAIRDILLRCSDQVVVGWWLLSARLRCLRPSVVGSVSIGDALGVVINTPTLVPLMYVIFKKSRMGARLEDMTARREGGRA
jgi:hypothetical protein